MKILLYDRLINDLLIVDINEVVKYYQTQKNSYKSLDNFMNTHNIKKEYKNILKKYIEKAGY